MSPSEFDLRAALRDGEGDDRVDVDRLVTEARAHGKQRRARLLSSAAAVVLVGAAAVGGALLWGGPSGDDHQAAGPAPTRSTFRSGPLSAASSSVPPGAPSCPTAYPGTSTPRIGSGTQPMFAAPIVSAVVCAYAEDVPIPTEPGSRLVVSGADATALTDSIEQASPTRLRIVCPDIRTSERKLLAVIAVTADGTVLPAVTTDVSIPNCNQPITNGTAVRYNWRPPAALAAKVAALR